MLKGNLDRLKEKLLESASLVQKMIEKSIEGLKQREEKLLLEVVEKDELRENALEVEIDEDCIRLIARYQPQAKDLRTIMMISKINNDLERMGDEAVNISESALFLIGKPEVKPLIDIPKMAEQAREMVSDCLDSFMLEDADMAKSVCERDDIVDALRDQILTELVTFMASDPATVERSNHLIRISRSLERIADLSTNISEDVIYMVKGKTIRHGRLEEMG
jgi:phosphate transport system protein